MHFRLSQNIKCLIFLLFVFIFGAGTVRSQITNLRFTGPAGYYAGSQFNPLPDVQVELLDANNNILGKANTDAQGSFEIHIPHTTDCTPTPAYHVDLFSQIWTFQQGSGSIVGCLAPGYHSFGNLNMIRVLSVSFEDAYTDQTNSNPNTGGGLRIYPDKKTPTDSVNRKMIKIRMWTTTSQSVVTVFYKIFDLDDPSANVAPIDSNASAGNDNKGTNSSPAVNLLQSVAINPFSSGLVEFRTTLNPGDNFAVVASASADYLNGITVDGTNLKDSGGNIITISDTSPRAAHRTEMLTVWRRLHIEYDSMANVPTTNNTPGTFTAGGQIPRGSRAVTVPVSNTLDVERFNGGRVTFGGYSLPVVGNSATEIYVMNTVHNFLSISAGQSFVLYDDDDYNEDDGTLMDGDTGEAITQLPDIFRHLSADEGNYSDNTPKNILQNAYMTPEYGWASHAGYDQSNITFNLNIEYVTNPISLDNAIAQHRDSSNSESDEFWVAYFVLGYQSPILNDFDGAVVHQNPNGTTTLFAEGAVEGVTPQLEQVPTRIRCDCINSAVCPSTGTVCASLLPIGGHGSVLFQETTRDVVRYFLSGSPSRSINDLKVTLPHELGHQFGLRGDHFGDVFKIMDYPDYLAGSNGPAVEFHPEHINIIRSRVKSPGQL